jgi:cytochrome c556
MGRTTRGVALAAAVVLAGGAPAQDKAPAIKEIMSRLNKPGGIYPTLSKELKADDTDWDDVRQQAKTFAKLAAALGKNAPPKGDAASWARLTKEYADNAQALEGAATRKDRTAARQAKDRLGGASCKTCHAAHMKK